MEDSGCEVRARLRQTFSWRTDPDQDSFYADDSGWLRDPLIVGALGSELARLHDGRRITAVMGVESRGTALACLTAQTLGVGVVEVRKEPERASHDDEWLTRTTMPDYRDRHLTLALRASLLAPNDHVLFVDDWIDSGSQAVACHQLVERVGATWAGAAVIVDSLSRHQVRRDLVVRSLLHSRDL